jgi:hypothetical protein
MTPVHHLTRREVQARAENPSGAVEILGFGSTLLV